MKDMLILQCFNALQSEPKWFRLCQESIKATGIEHKVFSLEEGLVLLPEEHKLNVQSKGLLAQYDVARVLLMKQALTQYATVVYLDWDVLVLDKSIFTLNKNLLLGFAYEKADLGMEFKNNWYITSSSINSLDQLLNQQYILAALPIPPGPASICLLGPGAASRVKAFHALDVIGLQPYDIRQGWKRALERVAGYKPKLVHLRSSMVNRLLPEAQFDILTKEIHDYFCLQ